MSNEFSGCPKDENRKSNIPKKRRTGIRRRPWGWPADARPCGARGGEDQLTSTSPVISLGISMSMRVRSVGAMSPSLPGLTFLYFACFQHFLTKRL